MKYIIQLSILCLLATTTIFCPPKAQPKLPLPLPPQRLQAPLPAQRLQVPQSAVQPRITIYDAGFIRQTPNCTLIAFKGFPEISLSCTQTRNFTITFEAYENGNEKQIIAYGQTETDLIQAQNIGYQHEPNIVLESDQHPINTPHAKPTTSCTFEWPELNIRHIFFVYQKAAHQSPCIEYVQVNDTAGVRDAAVLGIAQDQIKFHK